MLTAYGPEMARVFDPCDTRTLPRVSDTKLTGLSLLAVTAAGVPGVVGGLDARKPRSRTGRDRGFIGPSTGSMAQLLVAAGIR